VAVGLEEFKSISTCKSTKDEWDKLQAVFKGTCTVRMSKLLMLTTQFEELEMGDHETLAIFCNKLRDIANQVFQLREQHQEEMLIRKTLRSLPLRFHAKVATIEEYRDVSKMRLDELMGVPVNL
jgi:hypothetical protein